MARKRTQQVARKALSDPSEAWPVLASREVVGAVQADGMGGQRVET